MDQFTNHFDIVTGRSSGGAHDRPGVNETIDVLTKLGILKEDLDYHLIRGSMIIVFLSFWVSKVVGVRSTSIDSEYQQWPGDFFGCTRLSASGGPVGFRTSRNGCFACSCWAPMGSFHGTAWADC